VCVTVRRSAPHVCWNVVTGAFEAWRVFVSQIVLLMQSDVADAKSVQDALANSIEGTFAVEWVRLCSEGLGRLASLGAPGAPEERAIAAVLLDLFLSDCTGIQTFERIYNAVPQIPILILSDPKDTELAKLAIRGGAQEYLLKSRLDNYLLPKALISMIERAAISESLFEEKERAQVTLNSIGDAVLSTDVRGRVTYLNVVAEAMTGWSREAAAGRLFEEVFRMVHPITRAAIPNPMLLAIKENRPVGLTPDCTLIRRDGFESAIEDSAAPIHDRRGIVTGAVMVFHDVSKARAVALRMSHLAQFDSLTDLPNRTLLNDRLAEAIALAHRHRRKLAVLYLDVDRFKYINDSLGHETGDRFLQSVAQRLRACVRNSDTVSRRGGDEFVVLLGEIARAEDAAVLAEKIVVAMRKPFPVDGHELRVTASVGIANYPDDGADGESLLRNADVAMYHAKESGRDNFQFFSPEMNIRVVDRQTVESELRGAVDRQEFVLHYQPKINLETSAAIGVEALVRWRHPQRGLLLPSEFIAIAEDTALIVPIGRWVLGEACRQARVWQKAGLVPTTIAVNVSAVELRAKDFVSSVRAILAETGLESQYLELELTETFLMQDSSATQTVLKALKDIGVRIALDDFGTGYSSLSYLKRFPIDTLKIDRSFVRDLTSDAGDASIVEAVISLGRSLHMRVVAEGVETQEQLAFLRQQNCPEGQGYYFSPAVIAGEFAQYQGGDTRKPV
jgi:diguanylate cyclase (GGDEF)-like protein/PAS domain S-box-containing protein